MILGFAGGGSRRRGLRGLRGDAGGLRGKNGTWCRSGPAPRAHRFPPRAAVGLPASPVPAASTDPAEREGSLRSSQHTRQQPPPTHSPKWSVAASPLPRRASRTPVAPFPPGDRTPPPPAAPRRAPPRERARAPRRSSRACPPPAAWVSPGRGAAGGRAGRHRRADFRSSAFPPGDLGGRLPRLPRAAVSPRGSPRQRAPTLGSPASAAPGG